MLQGAHDVADAMWDEPTIGAKNGHSDWIADLTGRLAASRRLAREIGRPESALDEAPKK